jgi:hypothetical protein
MPQLAKCQREPLQSVSIDFGQLTAKEPVHEAVGSEQHQRHGSEPPPLLAAAGIQRLAARLELCPENTYLYLSSRLKPSCSHRLPSATVAELTPSKR